jgi:hypothetical protein
MLGKVLACGFLKNIRVFWAGIYKGKRKRYYSESFPKSCSIIEEELWGVLAMEAM